MAEITQEQADEFYQLRQNDPPDDSKFLEYGMRYHRECELFDQLVCVKRDRRGIAIPQGDEVRLVTENAKLVMRSLAAEIARKFELKAGVAESKILDAIRSTIKQFDLEWDREPQITDVETEAGKLLQAISPVDGEMRSIHQCLECKRLFGRRFIPYGLGEGLTVNACICYAVNGGRTRTRVVVESKP